MDNEKLTIIIPVYNKSHDLPSCLDSVIHQNYENLEILCIDDGSTDNSLEILHNYSKIDQRIKVLQHETNMGLLKARRTGIENSHGTYIMFLDPDDTLDHSLCKCAVHSILNNNADIVQFSARKINIDTNRQEIIYPCEIQCSGTQILNIVYITREVDAMLCIKIYRSSLLKKAFSKIPDFYCYVGEDILSSFFVSFYAKSFKGIDTRPKYNYYYGRGINSDRTVSLEKFKQYCEMSQFPEIIYEFLQNEKADEEAYKAYECMTIRLLSDCCSLFANINDQDKEIAVNIFYDKWGKVPNFSRYLLEAFTDQTKYINLIYNSNSYRIGNTIVLPLHNLKTKLKLQ